MCICVEHGNVEADSTALATREHTDMFNMCGLYVYVMCTHALNYIIYGAKVIDSHCVCVHAHGSVCLPVCVRVRMHEASGMVLVNESTVVRGYGVRMWGALGSARCWSD